MERPLERDPEKLVAAFFEYFNEFDFDKNAVLLRAPQTIAECLDPLAKQHIVTESVWTTKKETEVMAVVLLRLRKFHFQPLYFNYSILELYTSLLVHIKQIRSMGPTTGFGSQRKQGTGSP